MLTCTCSIASIEIGATPVRSPGWPPRPNELLNAAPLTGHVVHAVIRAAERVGAE
jgi:hypothetical protein